MSPEKIQLAGQLILLAGLAAGSIWDLKYRLIPNTVTYGLIATGFLLAWLSGSFTSSLLAFALMIPFVCLLAFLGNLGGGDAKLLLAISTFLGAMHAIYFAATFLAIAAVYSTVWLLALKIGERNTLTASVPRLESESTGTAFSVKIPFAPPIACAALWVSFAPGSLGI